MSDVKILTATHGHFDHVAAMADLKKMTGARWLSRSATRTCWSPAARRRFSLGPTRLRRAFPTVKVDRTFKDGGTISLGGTTLTTHLHPGHTKGATSFTTDVRENGKTYRVVIANMGSINPGVTVTGMPTYPGIMQDYAQTFAAQKAMKIDVFLASHASQFRMHDKYKPGDAYNPDRFVDPEGFLQAVSGLEKTYLAQVAKEKVGATQAPSTPVAPADSATSVTYPAKPARAKGSTSSFFPATRSIAAKRGCRCWPRS